MIQPTEITIYSHDGQILNRWFEDPKFEDLPDLSETYERIYEFQKQISPIMQAAFIGMTVSLSPVMDAIINACIQLQSVMEEIEKRFLPFDNLIEDAYHQLPRSVRWEMERKERHRARYNRRYSRIKEQRS